MSEPTFWSRFRNVDDAGAGALTAYLDAYNALAPVAAGKARSLELLRIAAGDAVLDVGCGTGDEARALSAAVGRAGRVVGVDASEHLIAEARRRAREAAVDVDFAVADASALPFSDAEFDGCRCDRTLQHLETPAQALGEMLRVVRAGGRVVVTETGNALEGEPTVDPDLLARARERFAPIGAREGWFGAFVPLLLKRAGVEDMGVDEQRGELTEATAVIRALNLDEALGALAEEGRCGRDDAQTLLANLRRDVEEGRVRAVVRTFHFYGTVPAAPGRES